MDVIDHREDPDVAQLADFSQFWLGPIAIAVFGRGLSPSSTAIEEAVRRDAFLADAGLRQALALARAA